eukprot:7865807-Pyramimonas_sp.AAC.1
MRPSGFKVRSISGERAERDVAASLVSDLKRGRLLGALMGAGFTSDHSLHVGRVCRAARNMNVPCLIVDYDCEARLRPQLERIT